MIPSGTGFGHLSLPPGETQSTANKALVCFFARLSDKPMLAVRVLSGEAESRDPGV
jgi:hypothetical protein